MKVSITMRMVTNKARGLVIYILVKVVEVLKWKSKVMKIVPEAVILILKVLMSMTNLQIKIIIRLRNNT
jgi:hypothetical protein